MINPVCSRCIYLSSEQVKFRPCPRIPIFHRDMLCANEKNAKKDHIAGNPFRPYCEEVNRHGECLVYKPVGLEKPVINFIEGDELLCIYGSNPFIFTLNGTDPSTKMSVYGEQNAEDGVFCYEMKLDHSCVVKAACIADGVLSDIEETVCEIPDVPVIEFDKETNTVSIKSYNKVFYTTDGSRVTEDSLVYTEPFVIDHNTVIKACSYARYELSEQVSEYCISIEPPVIDFDPATSTVVLSADDPILFTLDGSDIYDDSTPYTEPIVLTENTLVKAACIVNDELSEIVEVECKVANPPVITYDKDSRKVTIESDNPVYYTTDGSSVKKSSTLYTSPFVINEMCTVKAASFANDRFSEETELECIYVKAPEIEFDANNNLVSISGEYPILYSTDGSKIYDDSDEYVDSFIIDKNTTVRAACIFNDTLSDEVVLVCKVPSVPKISFNQTTKTVTITGENTILYTTDGSDVRKKDSEYKSAFKITQTTTVKARTIVDNRMSEQAELECVI